MASFTLICFGLSTTIGAAQAETYYFHTDHLNTPKVLTDATKQVVWQGNAKPFGETEEVVNAVDNPLRFPGQYFDVETGLNYNYMRDYDASLGRYVQSDPIGLTGGVSTYGYAGQNPINAYDPNGEFAIPMPLMFAGVVAYLGFLVAMIEAQRAGQILVDVEFIQLYDGLDFGDAINDSDYDLKDCDKDCQKQQKSLIASGNFIMDLYYGTSETEEDVLAAQKAIQRHNKRVSVHNKKCPNYPVMHLPAIVF